MLPRKIPGRSPARATLDVQISTLICASGDFFVILQPILIELLRGGRINIDGDLNYKLYNMMKYY